MGAERATEDIITKVNLLLTKDFNNRNSLEKVLYRSYRKIKSVNESVFKNGDKMYFLMKSDHLWNKIGFIDAICPNSKYIWITRDSYSHVNSLNKHYHRVAKEENVSVAYPAGNSGWSFSHCEGGMEDRINFSIKDVTDYWVNSNFHAISTLKKLTTARSFFVKFEDLMIRPQDVLSRTGVFLDLDLNHKIYTGLVNNLTQNPLSDWENHLSSSEKLDISTVLDSNKKRVRYILENS